jgi:hypothetical protein
MIGCVADKIDDEKYLATKGSEVPQKKNRTKQLPN